MANSKTAFVRGMEPLELSASSVGLEPNTWYEIQVKNAVDLAIYKHESADLPSTTDPNVFGAAKIAKGSMSTAYIRFTSNELMQQVITRDFHQDQVCAGSFAG